MPASPDVFTSAQSPLIISVDDHVQEQPGVWQDRLPARFREVGPRVVRQRLARVAPDMNALDATSPVPDEEDGVWCDVWHYEDVRVPMLRSFVAAGLDPTDVDLEMVTYDEMRPGSYDPVARLSDMDLNGVEASLCFPNLFVRFCGQRFLTAKDPELSLLCVRAYNDWMLGEWAAVSPERLLPAAIIPLWDAELAGAEVRRNAARGCRAVCFSELPTWLGLPSIYTGYWEPFLRACNDTATVVCMHIGSSSTGAISSPDAPACVRVANDYTKSSLSLSDWLMSGIFERHENIKVLYAEAQAGWMPYITTRLDGMWRDANAYTEAAKLPSPPSSYLRDHVYSCIFDDPIAIRHLDEMSIDNLCFETDYPHPDGTWPESQAVARRHLHGLPAETVEKILRGNAIRLLRLGG